MKAPKSNFVFSQIPSVVRPRSTFDRSRYYKSTFDEGSLIPFFWDEVLPGDTFSLTSSSFARLATLIVPFMDNLYLDFFFFFVPNRLVWENWQRFCGEQDNPGDSTDYLVPQVEVVRASAQTNSIYDYFGLPIYKDYSVSSLLFRSYNLIWNEFFRDENLQDSVDVPLGDGPDLPSLYKLLPRGKRKTDPFTSALPWPQKGPGVELSLAGSGSVGIRSAEGVVMPLYASPSSTHVSQSLASNSSLGLNLSSTLYTNSSSGSLTVQSVPTSSGSVSEGLPLAADFSSATAITINSLREAFQIQKWYEQLARGGSRYVELVLSMFGVHTGDARLQRPEYLGGGSTPIQIHSVAQTSAASTDPAFQVTTPQGNLSAYGIAAHSGIGFTKSFVEHGHIIGLVSVRGDYGYQQGIDRFWSRRTKFDFYWPAFAHLGEVPVLNKELYYQGNPSVDDQAFGYQERWYEYRYGINKITGKLRSGVGVNLSFWHLAQFFENLPTLNSTFIEERPPVERVLAVQNEPHFIFDSVIKCRCTRVMPVYSTPGLVDHF